MQATLTHTQRNTRIQMVQLNVCWLWDVPRSLNIKSVSAGSRMNVRCTIVFIQVWAVWLESVDLCPSLIDSLTAWASFCDCSAGRRVRNIKYLRPESHTRVSTCFSVSTHMLSTNTARLSASCCYCRAAHQTLSSLSSPCTHTHTIRKSLCFICFRAHTHTHTISEFNICQACQCVCAVSASEPQI